MLLIGLIFLVQFQEPANLATGVRTACAAKFSFKKNNDLKNLYFLKIPFHTYVLCNFGDVVEMWWLVGWRCGGSLLVHQTSEADVLGLNPASPSMILGHCRINV